MLPSIHTALYSALSNHANLIGLVGNRIHALQAPLGTNPPYVIFQPVDADWTAASPRPALDVRYRVVCIATTQPPAEQGAGYIYDALHGQTLTITGWHNYDTALVESLAKIENAEGAVYYKIGGVYRIRADEND